MTDIFENTYHFSSSNVGLAYLGLGAGMLLGQAIMGFASDYLVKTAMRRNNGKMKPEFRLPPMIPAAFFIPAGLFMYGWSSKYAVQWIVPIIGTSFVGLGLIGTFVSTARTLNLPTPLGETPCSIPSRSSVSLSTTNGLMNLYGCQF